MDLGGALAPPAARDAGSIQADQVSFLVFAYVCCVNHEQWFVKHEVRRLTCVVETLTPAEKVTVLVVLQLEARPMAAELRALRELAGRREKLSREEHSRARALQALVRAFAQLVVGSDPRAVSEAEWHEFHLVAFEDAAPLVARRSVVLHAGSAFVENGQLAGRGLQLMKRST